MTLRPFICLLAILIASTSSAAELSGRVVDASGAPLPGVTIEVRTGTNDHVLVTTSGEGGRYILTVPPGSATMTLRLLNFATVVRDVEVTEPGVTARDATMLLQVSADVVVTAKASFRNLAELDGTFDDLIGIADAGSVGVVSGEQIDRRPVQRPGEILETIPGVVISQHSGEGKANQYYLRGFNLDHGTDFAVSVAGVPVNMPTHGHGQGYADTNFLIPELITAVQYKKGPYFADEGDFSSAGAANINYANRLDESLVLLQGGSFGHRRALVAGSTGLWGGLALGAIESVGNDGPWVRPTDLEKTNGVLRFTRGDHRGGWSVTAMGYRSRWNSTDQIPRRAVEQGSITRFDTIDHSDGGDTHRYSLSGAWQRGDDDAVTHVSGYAIDYALDLYSNFTYFLDDPERGDQFQQVDDRNVYGASATHRWRSGSAENLAGVQMRVDDINEVGLHRTQARRRFASIRDDRVVQASIAAFFQNSMQWREWLRIVSGIRGDVYQFDVDSDLEANSGQESDSLLSPKLSLILGPWRRTEFYVNAGYSFHSNDGRGATARINPVNGATVTSVDPLVRSRGAEIGLRSRPTSALTFTSALWMLELESELLFVGDAGSTEATRPSERRGVELDATVRIGPVLLDADVAWSHARYADADPVGNHIPGSVGAVASIGASYTNTSSASRNWSGEIRYRLLGSRPLIEDASIRSDPSHLVSARIFHPLPHGLRLQLDVFNVFDARVSDVDYFYTSRLRGEPLEGIDDVHTHPAEPRSVRVGLSYRF